MGVQVTDADGGKGTTSATVTVVSPRAALAVKIKPDHFKVSVDGVDRKHGWSSLFDVGSVVKVAAAKKQTLRGVVYEFVRWSDGRRRKHQVTVTASGMTLKAVYKRQT